MTSSERSLHSTSGAAPWKSLGRGLLWLWDHSLGYVLQAVLLGLIWLYQRTISPLLPPSCRFHPSCSAYGFAAIRVHGSAKGLALAVWRLLRCNPWNRGGLDPVPEPGRWMPDIYPDGRSRLDRVEREETTTQPPLPGRRPT